MIARTGLLSTTRTGSKAAFFPGCKVDLKVHDDREPLVIWGIPGW